MLPVWKEPPSIDQITEKIYLGNECGAHNEALLKEKEITHILVAGNYLHQKFPKDYKYFKLPLVDRVTQDLFPHFQEAMDFIDSSDRVLVHCAGGMSRSAAVVIAFLMIKNKWKYQQAFEYVKEKRPIVCPNEGFITQLKKLEEMVESENLDLSIYASNIFVKKK